MKKKKPVWLILFVLFLLLLVFGIAVLLIQGKKEKTANDSYIEMQNEVNKVVENVVPETETEVEENNALDGIEIPEKNLDWDSLHEENQDIYAWIYVPNTTVDYPILQHPTDNSYYLNYNIDGTKGYPGCIYTEDYNSKDFSDINTVIQCLIILMNYGLFDYVVMCLKFGICLRQGKCLILNMNSKTKF